MFALSTDETIFFEFTEKMNSDKELNPIAIAYLICKKYGVKNPPENFINELIEDYL